MTPPLGNPPEPVAIFPFDYAHTGSHADVSRIVGGKGASLWALSRLDVPVPPGFTIGTSECEGFLRYGMTARLRSAVRAALAVLEGQVGRRFGDAERPLLLSVRSGAAASMPGMMDTVLNVGLTPHTFAGLARMTNDRGFALDSYKRFLMNFATSALGLQLPDVRDETDVEGAVAGLRHFVANVDAACLADPFEQLDRAISAVFNSWHSARARTYREHEGIPSDVGTAVTVQAMVFGNLDARSGTGVVFTRDPSTGEPRPRGDFLLRAQGEDVVSGTRRTCGIEEFERAFPDSYATLRDIMDRLELYYRDMCDIEFTVESGKLWILQSRRGKRAPKAATRIAVDLARDRRFGLSERDAVALVPAHVLADVAGSRHAMSGRDAIAAGIGASPGVATGRVVFDPDRAIERVAAGEAVILARRETSPADVHGMSVASGILTALGGQMSHAAVVAREWGIPAVCGLAELSFAPDAMTIGSSTFNEGEVISIDGGTGEIFLGEIETLLEEDEYLAVLRAWAIANEPAAQLADR